MKKAIYELDELENLVEEEEEQEEEEDEDDVVDRGDDFDPDDDDEDEDEGNDDEDDEIDDVEDDEDDEDDDESSDEDEGDEDDDEVDDEEDAAPRIPKGRFDEVIAQREAERERVRWLEEQLEHIIQNNGAGQSNKQAEPEPEPEYDFDDAEERYVDLVLEGDKTEARKLRKEIDNAKEKALEAKMAKIREETESNAKTVSESAVQEQKYERVLQQSLEQHDFLNHESDSYNAKAVTMANTLMKAYVADGDTKADALEKAVKEITPFYEKDTTAAKSRSQERAKQARRKAADASKKQPKDTAKRGNSKSRRDLEAIRIDKMSERDFDKLTAREKKALRGD